MSTGRFRGAGYSTVVNTGTLKLGNNERLASGRAKTVADELIKLGVPASRLTIAGRAKEGLIAADRGPASRNRRVEFHLAFINE